mmetsp:Transcript_113257/g.243968  ORF Transcript_113257/g.243968 Transcript_113257/m.243968 type:complete len:504 (+) Transcript_113257:1-1512(+)
MNKQAAELERTDSGAEDLVAASLTGVRAQTIYNTLSRSKQPFTPLEAGVVRMYVCGVTVYDLCHLGHARCMVFFDIVARYFKSQGYKVHYVRNVTDIDDKIIRKAGELGETAEALARRMEEEMQKDAANLGCDPPNVEPRVSEHIPEIMSMVETLVEKSHAYSGTPEEGEGLDVYFRVRSFPTYGRLSRCSLDGNQAGARVDVSKGKEAAEDFVLWKAAKPREPQWTSPWGPGRPGWHIECSAMAKRHLGDTLDIHGGGPDLIFPHHENEIAQSEAASGKAYAKTWMHCAAVRSLGGGEEKMSKSLGNFVTIRDALGRHDGEALRFYLISSQYRQPLLYSEENIAAASERLLKLYSALRGVELGDDAAADFSESDAWKRFHEAMSNDFDTVTALAVMSEVSRTLLQQQQEGADAAACAETGRMLRAMGGVLGLLQRDPEEVLRGGSEGEDNGLAEKMEGLIADRAAARKAKDWGRADEIRDEIASLGVTIEDTPKGTTWRVSG